MFCKNFFFLELIKDSLRSFYYSSLCLLIHVSRRGELMSHLAQQVYWRQQGLQLQPQLPKDNEHLLIY